MTRHRAQHRRDLVVVCTRLPLILAAGVAAILLGSALLFSVGRWAAGLLGWPT